MLLKLKRINITKEIKKFITEVVRAIVLLNLKFLELSEIVETVNIPIIGTNNSEISNIYGLLEINEFSS